jgi:hypothetical protein
VALAGLSSIETFQRLRRLGDVDPEAEARRPLPEGRTAGRGGKPGFDQFVDRIAQPDVPLFAKPLDGSRDIIIQGEGGCITS